MNNLGSTAGCTLIFLDHIEAEGRGLVRCLVVDEDPENRACVSHMIQAFGLYTDSHRQTKAD